MRTFAFNKIIYEFNILKTQSIHLMFLNYTHILYSMNIHSILYLSTKWTIQSIHLLHSEVASCYSDHLTIDLLANYLNLTIQLDLLSYVSLSL